MDNLVNYRVDGGVAIVELNDPPANTYTYEMNKALDGCVLAARMDDAVHVIVLRGAGEKFFCAGANIGMLKEADPEFNAKQFTPPNKAAKAAMPNHAWNM